MKNKQATTYSPGNNDYVMSDEDFKRIKESIEDIEAGNVITVPSGLSKDEIREFILNSKFD